MRTRLQSSIGTSLTAGGGATGGGGVSVTTFGTERASQFAGGWRRGRPRRRRRSWSAKISAWPSCAAGGFTGVGIGELVAAGLAASACARLRPTLPFSGICPKLGDVRLGSVCKLSDSKTVACSLRWKARSALGHPAKQIHLLRRQKLSHFGPPLGALLGSNLHQPVPVLDDRKFVSVFDGRGNGRLQR